MIDTQLFHDVILILAVLIAMTLALTAAMMLAARSVPGTGQTPRGGNRRDLPQDPQPEPDGFRELRRGEAFRPVLIQVLRDL